MSTTRGELGKFLREVMDWEWREFLEADKNAEFTGLQSSVFALVRAAAEGKLAGIKMAIDRLDGKVETPIRVEYPKVFVRYPFATKLALPTEEEMANEVTPLLESSETPTPEPLSKAEVVDEEPESAAVLTLRETVEKMAGLKRTLPLVVLDQKARFDMGRATPDDPCPLVKSIIAANLLRLVESNDFAAIIEIFERIDGKLTETYRVIGEDITIDSYALEAPFNAKKGADGVYFVQAEAVQNMWAEKLASESARR